MTSNFEAKITVDAGEKTKAIFDSVHTDNKFYPENPKKHIDRVERGKRDTQIS